MASRNQRRQNLKDRGQIKDSSYAGGLQSYWADRRLLNIEFEPIRRVINQKLNEVIPEMEKQLNNGSESAESIEKGLEKGIYAKSKAGRIYVTKLGRLAVGANLRKAMEGSKK